MYFKDKEDTNIDDEFRNNNKFNFDLSGLFNNKRLLMIIGGIILLIIILFAIIYFNNHKIRYYISLTGNDEITIYQGDEYVEPGYTGFDNKNNDLTDDIIVDNQININEIGNYAVIYTLNNTIKERRIRVIAKPVGATYIYLLGDINIYLNLNDEYKEPGYEVIDTALGDKLKDNMQITNNVDTSKAGVYQIIYSVVNSSGVTTSKVRNVIVMDSNISLTLDNTNYTNNDININVYVNDNYFNYLILPDNNKITDRKYAYKVSNNGTYKFIVYNKQEKVLKKRLLLIILIKRFLLEHVHITIIMGLI